MNEKATDLNDSRLPPALPRQPAPRNTFLQNKANFEPESQLGICTPDAVINYLERNHSLRNFGFDPVFWQLNPTTTGTPTLLTVRP